MRIRLGGVLWVIFAVVAAALMAMTSPRQDVITLSGLVIMTGFGVGSLRRAVLLAWQMRRQYQRQIFRTVGMLRRLFRVTPSVKVLHFSAWTLGCMAVA